jgi:hypothetical protein
MIVIDTQPHHANHKTVISPAKSPDTNPQVYILKFLETSKIFLELE